MGRPLGRKTITVERAPRVVNTYGDTVPDWSGTLTQTVYTGCDVQPGTTQEYLIGRDNVLVAWTVFRAGPIDVTEFDRVLFNGRTYEVYGHPAEWDSYSGRQDYTEIVLKDWSG
jgi:hypothetical protein